MEMSRTTEFETTINGGLPVFVKAVLYPPEPDIGIFEWTPEFDIFWMKGGRCNINLSDADWRRIDRECLEAVFG